MTELARRPPKPGQERIPLADLKNFGPITLAEFHAMALFHLDQLEAMGFERTCRRWVQSYPTRLNANAFLGIVCVLEGTVWTDATSTQRAAARALVQELKQELGQAAPKRKRGR